MPTPITRQTIQKDLLSEFRRTRPLFLFLTAFTAVGMLGWIWGLCNGFPKSTESHGSYRSALLNLLPTEAIYFVMFLVLLMLALLLWHFYYSNLYYAKKGRFSVTVETLCEKKEESHHVRGVSQTVYRLYFRCDTASVDRAAFSKAKVGEECYVVRLGSRLRLVYPKRLYTYHPNTTVD